jgi:hypothetical protein
MRVNQNFSPELELYPKMNRHISLLTQPRPHSYQRAIGHRTGLGNENVAETLINVSKTMCEDSATKIKQ